MPANCVLKGSDRDGLAPEPRGPSMFFGGLGYMITFADDFQKPACINEQQAVRSKQVALYLIFRSVDFLQVNGDTVFPWFVDGDVANSV